jgi:pimeloyl-ACP methyl ester carboxylesterase
MRGRIEVSNDPGAALPETPSSLSKGGTIHLRDGRALAYEEWGDSEGRPVFLFHGSPGSRLFRPNQEVTASSHVRLFTVDRPGYGRSDPDPGRTMLDWADDVAELANALEIDRFAVVGTSSGSPYALACAVKLPARVRRVGLVSTTVPLDEVPTAWGDADEKERELVELARRDPTQAVKAVTEGAGWLLERPEMFLDFPRPDPDRQMLEDPEVRAMYLDQILEAVRPGLEGFGWDEVLERNPWGFRLADVKAQVYLWHGDQDPYIPRSHVEAMVSQIANCQTTFYPDEAHGLIVTRWREILATLTS